MVESELCSNCKYERVCKYKEKINEIESENIGKIRGIGWHIVIGACVFQTKKDGE